MGYRVNAASIKPQVEWCCWLLLLVFVVVTRFYALGARAMSHDESLHAFYSWQYAREGVYEHDPMMHGPLLFHMNAAVFRLLGDNDWTARMMPAVAGVFLVALLWLFRGYLGRGGALVAAILTAFAPDILFYSRYIRNDIYICTFLLLWLYGVFRYLEKPQARWLCWLAVVLALSFSCKEVSFIHIVIIALFLVLRVVFLLCRRGELDVGALDLVIFMGVLTIPFACPLLHVLPGWDPLDVQTATGQRRTFLLGGGLALGGAVLAGVWLLSRRRFGHADRPGPLAWVMGAFLFWGIVVSLFTSLFRHTLPGLASGLAGSLGYWLAQHGVQRGGQPHYYYLMLLLLYHPGLLLCAGGGLLRVASEGLLHVRADPSAGDRQGQAPALFLLFTAFWVVAAAAAYTWAGERMPWLLVYVTLPMCLLGGWWLFGFARSILFSARRTSLRALSLGFILVCLWVSLVAAYRLTFVNQDLATELLVYAHGSDRIKPLVGLLEELEAVHAVPEVPLVAYDQPSAWPLRWYLRNIPHRFFTRPDASLRSLPVILAGNQHVPAIQSLTSDSHVMTTFPRIWWPMQGYMDMSPARLAGVLKDPSSRVALWRVIVAREYGVGDFNAWPLRDDMTLFLWREWATPERLDRVSRSPSRKAE